MTVVGRFDRPDGRWYIDPLDSERVYESVTAALSAASGKPWLTAWAAKLAAQYTVEHLDEVQAVLAGTGRDAAIDLIKGAARRSRDRKADVGGYVHEVIEALILDASIPSIPEHLDGQAVDYDGETITIGQTWLDTIIDGFLNFVVDHQPEFEMAEATVVNPQAGYAGTLDMIAVLPRLVTGTRVMIDTKTGATLDKRMSAQMAAYRRCTEVWLDDLGNRAPMPRVDRAAVLHLRPSYGRGYKLLDQPADEQAYAWFEYHLQVLRGEERAPKPTGRPLYPARADGTQPAPLIEDIDVEGFNPYRKKLIAAGVLSLDALAAMRKGDVTLIKGLGAKAPDHCEAALRRYGLAFTEDVLDVEEALVLDVEEALDAVRTEDQARAGVA